MGPDINVDLSEFPKNQTPWCVYIYIYIGVSKINDQLYRNHIVIYTDGSKGETGFGAAAVCEGMVRT